MARKKKRRTRGKSTSKRRKPIRKSASKRRKSRRKPARKFTPRRRVARGKKARAPTRRELQDRIRRQELTIKELADQSRTRRTLKLTPEEEEEEIPEGPARLPGEVPVRDSEGEIIGYSLPETQESFEDIDFGSWDDFYDDVEDYLDEDDHETDTGSPAK